MADSCAQYVSTDDLKAAKESIVHIEHVATSKDANGNPALVVTDPIRGVGYTNTTLDGLFSDIGFKPVNGSFEDGGTLVNRWDTLLYETNGSFYQWMGELPHTVPAGSSPFDSSGDLITGWVDQADLTLRTELASNAIGKGASIVVTENGDTVQDALNKVSGIVNVQSFYSGSGFYNTAVLAAAAAGKEIFLGGDVTLDPSVLLDLSAFHNRRYYGGRFINGNILIRGMLDTPITLNNAITIKQKDFTENNNFSVGDLILIKNFPTNTNDDYTEGTPSLFMSGPRTYAVTGPGTLRDTRRKQLFDISVASSTSFSTYQESISDFSTASLTATRVNAVKGVSFDCDFKGGTLWCEMTDGLSITGRFENTFLNNCTCIRSNIKPVEFFSTTDARIDCFEACSGFKINTITSGHTSSADNSIIKILGCNNFDLDIVITGTNVVTGYAHGVMTDCIFEENPSGYPSLDNVNYTCRVNVSGIDSTVNGSHAVSIVTDPYRARNSDGLVTVNSPRGTVHVKGAVDCVLEGRVSILSLEGSGRIDVGNLRRESDYQADWISPYGPVENYSHIGVLYQTTGVTVSGETTPGTATVTANLCSFERIGRRVTVNAEISYTGLTGTGNLTVNLPTIWSPKGPSQGDFTSQVSGQNNVYGRLVYGTRNVQFYRNDTSKIQATDVVSGTIRLSGSYIVDFITL